MLNDLSNQKTNADVVIKEALTPARFWFPLLAITLLAGLGTVFLIQQDYAIGLSLILIAGFIWMQLK